MTTPAEYAQKNGGRFIEELKEVLRIPSISSMSDHNADTYRAAEWFCAQCLAVGMTHAEVIDTPGHPMVYAEWLGAGANAPTVLVYGHYDVQPVDDPNNEWESPPFEPAERKGNLYARGATDDKGQTLIHLKAFESFMQTTGRFPVNIKVMLEGEEESASPNLLPFVQQYLEQLRCDLVVISDSDNVSEHQPSIYYGLRGLVYTEVEVKGPAIDLHSGSFGGAVHNPAQALVEILAQLHDASGRVTVPGFYDDVVALTPAERQALAATPESEADVLAVAGVPQGWGEAGYTVHERIGARPTLEINGIVGGWTGEGGKTVIPARASAKVSCRLVPHQDPEHIFQQLSGYIAQLTPPTVRSQVRRLGAGAPGVLVPIDSPAMQVAAAAYAKTFGVEPVFRRGGGSIPVVALYQEMLGVPVLMMGFGLPDDNLHAPNEKITLSMFHKGIQTMLHFYEDIARL